MPPKMPPKNQAKGEKNCCFFFGRCVVFFHRRLFVWIERVSMVCVFFDDVLQAYLMGVSENRYPQIIHFNRVFHYFHHPFWGPTPIFGFPPWWTRQTLESQPTSTSLCFNLLGWQGLAFLPSVLVLNSKGTVFLGLKGVTLVLKTPRNSWHGRVVERVSEPIFCWEMSWM